MSNLVQQPSNTLPPPPTVSNGFTFYNAAQLLDLPPMEWRVHNVLPTTGLAVIFGASGSGKSFLLLDLIAAIAEGNPWFGYETKPCRILCLVLEGQAGLNQRIRAWQEHNGRPYPENVSFVVNDFALNEDAKVADLQIAMRAAKGFDMVVIDTLNRAAPGADENSSTAMGELIKGAGELQKATKGLVVFIHHTGKDDTRGMRGHSSLHAATDTVIELKRTNGDEHGWRLLKSKDSEDGVSHSFHLSKVEFDSQAGQASSLIVEPLGSASGAFNESANGKPFGKNQMIVMERISLMLANSTEYGQGGASPETPCIKIKELLDELKEEMKTDRPIERAKDALKSLVKAGRICHVGDWVWKL